MKDWRQHLADLIGEKVEASPDASAAQGLPVFLGSAYEILRGRIIDEPARFLVPKRAGAPSLPDLVRDHAQAAKALGGEVVLVLPMAPPHVVKGLVRERIPFVVSGRQVFLPRHVVSLRAPGREGAPCADEDGVLSARTQFLLLYHMQKQSLSGRSQIEVSRTLGWSPMAVSRCVRELQAKGLCHALPGGRSNVLSLDKGRDLWDLAQQSLSSPVMARRFVRVPDRGAKGALCVAGASALSRYTMVAEDPIPCLAVHRRLLGDMERREALRVLPYKDEGCAALELWRYDPVPLAEDGVADRLSLYLSLKGSPDERVEGALGELVEGVRW